jgi:hypothetical protein
MTETISDFLVNTSIFLALLWGASAAGNYILFARTYRDPIHKLRIVKCLAHLSLAAMYVLTQYGGDWFLSYQRLYFRASLTFIVIVDILILFRVYESKRKAGLWTTPS